MQARILVVDDEKLIRWSIRERLTADGYQVIEAPDVAGAREALREKQVDLALFDMRLPDGDGVALMREAQRERPNLVGIIITAHSTVQNAVDAMKYGAYDYVSKPFQMDELSLIVKRALEHQAARHTVATETDQQRRRFGLECLIGEDPGFAAAKDIIRRVAASESTTVLLLGETGTGKDMAARAIHYESARAERPFMNITCTAMPETLIESELFGYAEGAFTDARGQKAGLFELAQHGTVFLDEIGDMPRALQAKLLRVLEEKTFRRVGGTADIQVDCRVIAATNRDLEDMIARGEFREDLYYRLSAVPVTIPPLRNRGRDILLLARNFLELYGRKFSRSLTGFAPEAENKLSAYAWPGNVRELRNVIERAALLCPGDRVEAADITLGRVVSNAGYNERESFQLPQEGCSLAEVERSLLEQALARTKGNQTQAAQLLGITRDQLRYRLEKFGNANT